jgi:cytosine deaminase
VGTVIYVAALLAILNRLGVSGSALWGTLTGFVAVGAVATKNRFLARWMPSDIRSFIRSWLPATDVNTSPTSFCFSATGTSRKPKWVVQGSWGSLMRRLSPIVPGMITTPDYRALLDTAIAEARQGLAEGGIPIGAALYHQDGRLLGCGHNRRVQEGDPSVHGETDAFRKAGRQRRYRDTIMVTTLAPCWYCSGLVRQFNIGTVVVGESVNFDGGLDWLREAGVNVVDLHDEECIAMLGDWIAANPETWSEDIGED